MCQAELVHVQACNPHDVTLSVHSAIDLKEISGNYPGGQKSQPAGILREPLRYLEVLVRHQAAVLELLFRRNLWSFCK